MAKSEDQSKKKAKEIVVNKLSTKTLGFDKKTIGVMLAENKEVYLYTVYGIVRKAEGGEGSNGTYVRFVGDFEAVGNGVEIVDGTVKDIGPFVARSSKLYVPGAFETELENRVLANTDEKGKVSPTQFAIKVGAKQSETSATGYEFTVEPLIKMQASDELAMLADAVSNVGK